MGYWEAHKKYGRLPWSELFGPVIKLCETGSRVNDYLAAYLAEKEPMIKNESSLVEILINPDTNKVWIVSNISLTVFKALIFSSDEYFVEWQNCAINRTLAEGRSNKETETCEDVEADSGRGSRCILQRQYYGQISR